MQSFAEANVITTKLFISLLPVSELCEIVTGVSAGQTNSSSPSSSPFPGWNTDPSNAKEIMINRPIEQVLPPHSGGTAGLHLVTGSGRGVFDVSTDPFLPADGPAHLSVGEQIQVTGIVQTMNGQSYVLARQPVVAWPTIPIRNEQGFFASALSHAGAVIHHQQTANHGGNQ
jgi:hypothetical protein